VVSVVSRQRIFIVLPNANIVNLRNRTWSIGVNAPLVSSLQRISAISMNVPVPSWVKHCLMKVISVQPIQSFLTLVGLARQRVTTNK
jgi:hypothetical protein